MDSNSDTKWGAFALANLAKAHICNFISNFRYCIRSSQVEVKHFVSKLFVIPPINANLFWEFKFILLCYFIQMGVEIITTINIISKHRLSSHPKFNWNTLFLIFLLFSNKVKLILEIQIYEFLTATNFISNFLPYFGNSNMSF